MIERLRRSYVAGVKYGRAIRILLAAESSSRGQTSLRRTDVVKVEVLENDSARTGNKILLDSLWRHYQAPFLERRNSLVVLDRRLFQPELFGKEKKSLLPG